PTSRRRSRKLPARPSCRAARYGSRPRSISACGTSRRRSPPSWRAIPRCASTCRSPIGWSTSWGRALISPSASAGRAPRTSSRAGSGAASGRAGLDRATPVAGPGTATPAARRLGETRLVACAAPAYLQAHGWPATPEDLVSHNCFTYEYASPRNVWHFRGPDGEDRAVRVSGTLHSNNGGLDVEGSARGGDGVFEPELTVPQTVRAGRLVRGQAALTPAA